MDPTLKREEEHLVVGAGVTFLPSEDGVGAEADGRQAKQEFTSK